MGGYFKGDWGDGPPKIWGGDGPCIRPPIFGEVVLWDARESTKCLKSEMKEFFCCEIEAFRQEKGHNIIWLQVYNVRQKTVND